MFEALEDENAPEAGAEPKETIEATSGNPRIGFVRGFIDPRYMLL